jgi:putative cardiolipin synthase
MVCSAVTAAAAGRRRLLSEGRRFGLHAKSIVIDDDIAMVGSHNFDPRSDHYNTEAGVIVYDQRFADPAAPEHPARHAAGKRLGDRTAASEGTVLSDINHAIGSVSEELPLFDLWPFRYATSYDRSNPGCQPMRVSDPGFFACYEPVGDFPDVGSRRCVSCSTRSPLITTLSAPDVHRRCS